MKKLIVISGIVLLVAAVAYPVLARGPMGGRGGHMMGYWGGGPGSQGTYGTGYPTLTEEQRGKLDGLYKGFHDENTTTRNEIWAKRAELNTLLNSPDPDTEKARALQKEISELQAKIAQGRVNLELEERKITPDTRSGSRYGMGHGRHMMGGYGSGMGHGRHMMGGYGSGMDYGRHMMGGYGSGMDYGRHMMGGYGPGMGYGRPTGGYGPGYAQGGPGNCWN